MSETVTVGDTEVEIRETEGGFEAVEVEEDDGPYIRGTNASFGFEVPVGSDLVVEKQATNYLAAWHTEDDRRDDLRSEGNSSARVDGYDGYGIVRTLEIVDE